MQRLGEYVVYVDESGDHGLAQINPQFPQGCSSPT